MKVTWSFLLRCYVVVGVALMLLPRPQFVDAPANRATSVIQRELTHEQYLAEQSIEGESEYYCWVVACTPEQWAELNPEPSMDGLAYPRYEPNYY